jgi:hypothetical protein
LKNTSIAASHTGAFSKIAEKDAREGLIGADRAQIEEVQWQRKWSNEQTALSPSIAQGAKNLFHF